MLKKYKKAYIESSSDVIVEPTCSLRHLVSISGSPNASGSCSSILVSFQLKGWVDGDFPETYSFTNAIPSTYIINECIDSNTLTTNCSTRVTIIWDDGINCCE